MEDGTTRHQVGAGWIRGVRGWPVLAALLICATPPARSAQPAPPVPSPQAPADTLALTGARVYAAPDAAPILDGVVVVAGGKIAAVGPRTGTAIPTGARMMDCKGLTVVAGFQNSHVHFELNRWADAGQAPAAKLTAQMQAMLTRYGFTTVVDAASFLPNTLALRRRVESGEVAGPRILTAGLGLYPPDGIPYYLKGLVPEEALKELPQPRTPADAVAVVRRQIAAGADITKLFTGTWVERGRVMPMPLDVAAAAVAESHRLGKMVFSHPSNVAGLEVALRAGVDVLAHAVEDLRGLTPDHLRQMRRQGMALIPTLKLFAEDNPLPAILDEVRDYARAGGEILFGTDVGFLADPDTTTEYVLLESAGLGWREILTALTTAPARRFGEATRRGRIAPGMDADLVVLGSDPALGARAFADVRWTLRGGRVIYAAPRPAS
jgi:imidazolonepropionase-like amidohydrolase